MSQIKQLLEDFFKSVFPNPQYRMVAALLFLVAIVLAWLLTVRKLRDHRANLVLGIVIVALLFMVMATAQLNRWQWIVGLLPTLMVGYQLFFLWLYHPKEVERTPPEGVDRAGQPQDLKEQSYRRAQDTISNHFSLRTLFTRYGLPAVLLGITGVVIVDVLVKPNDFFSVYYFFKAEKNGDVVNTILRGLRLGALGAYVYVLLELGRRTFRHDVTGAVAMWCWVTLVLGPVLAATVAFLWRMKEAPDSGWWGTGVVLFFAGFAPRRVIAALEKAALELLKIDTPAVVQTRLIPLSQIRGINPQIEERLGEEGITDVNSLASAEPVRLVRNTSFDMRQILAWIDEAILMVTLPRSWEELEEVGITGAIDLAWYYDQVVDPQTRKVLQPPSPVIDQLAQKAKLETGNFGATIQRLSEDTQLQYIWALYNNFTEYSGGERPGEDDDGQDAKWLESPPAP